MTFWLGTEAYRRQKNWLWGLTGLIYGLGFYTYLAFRFTPLLLLLLACYLVLTGRRRLWPGILWFIAGVFTSLLPFAYLIWQEPDLFFGRSGQVSILNPDVNEGSILLTLGRNILAAAGMFLWRGDYILRHNPSGRPVFDPMLAIPFLIGLVWCVKNWRLPTAAALLIWLAVMLGPTILAEDTPHFLRAAGVLPAAIMLPAVGLATLWEWTRLPERVGGLIVAAVVAGSLFRTVSDYRSYANDPELAYTFEAAATDLAEEIGSEPEESDVYLDSRLWTSWPSLEFLLAGMKQINLYDLGSGLPDTVQKPSAIFAWPYDSLDLVPQVIEPPALVVISDGAATKGDAEDAAYVLYVRYGIDAIPAIAREHEAIFDDQIYLRAANISQKDSKTLELDIYWEADGVVADELIVFTHVYGPEGIVGQVDRPLAGNRWHGAWWQPGIIIRETHIITLSEPFDEDRHEVGIGLYRSDSGERLPASDASNGIGAGTLWMLKNE